MRLVPLAGRLLIAVLLALHSAGCQSSAVTVAPDSAVAAERIRRADALVAEVPRNDGTAQQRLLTAARLYLSAQAYAKAVDALNRIDPTLLRREQRGDFLLTLVDAALGDNDVALAWATVARGAEGNHPFVDDIPAAERAQLSERRAIVQERRGRLVDAARERLDAARQLPADGRARNEQALWQLLGRMDHQGLQLLASDADAEMRGWAELAATQRSGDDPATLTALVVDWQSRNPDHPAASRLPPSLAQPAAAQSAGPRHIAVLLPLHGRLADAGSAIQRGMLAGWYQARASGVDVPVLRFHDASRSDFDALYDNAVAEGADLVVGPLDKEQLRLLQQRPQLPVPTIALNYPDADAGAAAPQLQFFGLAAEDEATQVARTLVANNMPRVAVLMPAGDWGARIGQQFADTLHAGGGRVVASGVFTGNADYGEVVRNLLDVAASELRHARVQRLSGLKLAFQARPRQDIDAIFIIGNTLQATQLAPAIRYNHAQRVPVYATSHVNGQLATGAAADLSGMRFVEMPWIIDGAQPLRRDSEVAWQRIDERYLRLYALGADAWRLARQLPLLQQGTVVDGVTGRLSLDPADRRIHRQLSWMQFRGNNTVPFTHER